MIIKNRSNKMISLFLTFAILCGGLFCIISSSNDVSATVGGTYNNVGGTFGNGTSWSSIGISSLNVSRGTTLAFLHGTGQPYTFPNGTDDLPTCYVILSWYYEGALQQTYVVKSNPGDTLTVSFNGIEYLANWTTNHTGFACGQYGTYELLTDQYTYDTLGHGAHDYFTFWFNVTGVVAPAMAAIVIQIGGAIGVLMLILGPLVGIWILRTQKNDNPVFGLGALVLLPLIGYVLIRIFILGT